MQARALRVLLCLAAVLPCRAHGAGLGLDAYTGYRGYEYDVNGTVSDSAIFYQNLHSALQGAIGSKALASYNLGFSLSHAGGADIGSQTEYLAYGYDGRLDFWPDGLVPASAYASRTTTDFSRNQVISGRAVSEAAGGRVALVVPHRPNIDVAGWRENYMEETEAGVSTRQRAMLEGRVSQVSDHVVTSGELQQATMIGPSADTSQTVTRAEADIVYSPSSTETFGVNGRDMSFQSIDGTTVSEYRVQNTSAWSKQAISDRSTGFARYDYSRLLLDEFESSTNDVSTRLLQRYDEHWEGDFGAGVSSTVLDSGDTVTRYLGENATGVGTYNGTIEQGSYTLGAGSGIAQYTELGVGTGFQEGLQALGSVSKAVAPARTQLYSKLTVQRQWDSSPVDLDLWGYDGSMGARSTPVDSVETEVSAGAWSVHQLSQDEGNSQNLWALARIGSGYLQGFSASASFMTVATRLDDVDATLNSAGASVGSSLIPSTVVSAQVLYNTRTSPTLDPMAWTFAQVESKTSIRAAWATLRFNRSWMTVGENQDAYTAVWAEVGRSFDWGI